MSAKLNLEEQRKLFLSRKEKKNESNSSNNAGMIDRKAAMLNSHGIAFGAKKPQKSDNLLIERNELEAFALDEALRIYYELSKGINKEDNDQHIINKEATLHLRQLVLEIVENIEQQHFKEITFSIPDPVQKSISDTKIREKMESIKILRKINSDTSISNISHEETPAQNMHLNCAINPEDIQKKEETITESQNAPGTGEDNEEIPLRGKAALARNKRLNARKSGTGGTSQRLSNIGRPFLTKEGACSLNSEDIPTITFTKSLIDTSIVIQLVNDKIREYFKNNQQFLSTAANNEKSNFEFYSCSVKGTRATNEDELVVIEHANSFVSSQSSNDYSFIAVFDGHSGKKASLYSRSQLHYNIFNHSEFNQHMNQAVYEGFLMVDQRVNELQQREKINFGTTALSVWINNKEIIVANVGDCRGFLYRNQTPIELTRSHNLHREDEKERILSLGGGAVPIYGVLRVNGTYAVTRSIGDLHIKHLLIPDPEISTFSISSSEENNDEYLIIASDGLWDVMNFQDAAEFINQSPRQTVCKLLCEEALARKSKDNVTIVIVYFNKKPTSSS